MSDLLIWVPLLTANFADAGAWTRPKGEGVAIFTTGRRATPVGGLTGGRASNDSNITQVYIEYGLFDGLTIGGTSFAELLTTDLSASSAALGGFFRKRFWQSGHGSVASVQFGYSHTIEALFGNSFSQSEPGAVREGHLAALYGMAGQGNGAVPSFLPALLTTCVTEFPTICDRGHSRLLPVAAMDGDPELLRLDTIGQ